MSPSVRIYLWGDGLQHVLGVHVVDDLQESGDASVGCCGVLVVDGVHDLLEPGGDFVEGPIKTHGVQTHIQVAGGESLVRLAADVPGRPW